MRRGWWIGVGVAAVVAATIAVPELVHRSEAQPGSRRIFRDPAEAMRIMDSLGAGMLFGQPDTRSPNWKQLSKDAGLMVTQKGRAGLRGQLYVKVDGRWRAVALDGPEGFGGFVLAR
ncbi:MAG TPA: hypothetical protein VJY35_16610 [Candidatus Eisenbacteria bacterium]|nr:hypothetical protein [Candidatus Eisenbacteria bacterium]